MLAFLPRSQAASDVLGLDYCRHDSHAMDAFFFCEKDASSMRCVGLPGATLHSISWPAIQSFHLSDKPIPPFSPSYQRRACEVTTLAY